MKWGIRRTPEQLGHKTGGSKTKWRVKKTTKEQRRAEKEAKARAKFEKKTEDLKRKQTLLQQKTDIERKKVELRKLKEGDKKAVVLNPTQTKQGKSWLKETLKKSGQEVAATYIKKAMTAGVEAIIASQKPTRRRRTIDDDPSSMTDEELRNIINRYNSERQLREIQEQRRRGGSS